METGGGKKVGSGGGGGGECKYVVEEGGEGGRKVGEGFWGWWFARISPRRVSLDLLLFLCGKVRERGFQVGREGDGWGGGSEGREKSEIAGVGWENRWKRGGGVPGVSRKSGGVGILIGGFPSRKEASSVAGDGCDDFGGEGDAT